MDSIDEKEINTAIKDLMLKKLKIHGTGYRLKEFFDDIRGLGLIAIEDYVNEIMEE